MEAWSIYYGFIDENLLLNSSPQDRYILDNKYIHRHRTISYRIAEKDERRYNVLLLDYLKLESNWLINYRMKNKLGVPVLDNDTLLEGRKKVLEGIRNGTIRAIRDGNNEYRRLNRLHIKEQILYDNTLLNFLDEK